MKLMKSVLLATALIAAPALAQEAAAPAPAEAQATPAAVATANPQVAVGATVYGPQGAVVGTIEQIANGIATVNTGTNKAPLPLSAFGQGEAGPTITVTQAQLNQLVEQQLAALAARRDAALVVGATVLTADNQQLGTIETVDGDNIVVLRGEPARRVTLLRNYFTADDTGLKARLTLQEIETAAAQATASTSATPAETPSAEATPGQ